MQLAMIGLGRMGGNMVQRLLGGGHEVVVYDRSADAVAASVAKGARAATGLANVVKQLTSPRVIWIMVPAGQPVEATIDELAPQLAKGDILIDGGNSNFKDTLRRAESLAAQGIEYVDAGTSGGVWGLTVGYCLMVGASPGAWATCEPIFKTLAPPDGCAHVGPPGAGHYVKMVHNGIEYGMLQAYAEGFALMDAATELELDLHQIAAVWQHGSVVRSWLLDLAELALADKEGFAQIKGYVEDSGEGRWTVTEAIDRAVPLPTITASLFARFSSRQENAYSARIIAALRNQFGGHQFFTEAQAAEQAKNAQGAEGEAEGIITSTAEVEDHHG